MKALLACGCAAELADASAFGAFYRFTFFVAREPAQRNLGVDTALAAWPLVLAGRFRLLDKWCAFVAGAHRLGITEDTWRQARARVRAAPDARRASQHQRSALQKPGSERASRLGACVNRRRCWTSAA
jgi:hypothetical protein